MNSVIDTQSHSTLDVVVTDSTTDNLLDILLQPEVQSSAEVEETEPADPIQVGAVFTSAKPKMVYTRKGKHNLVKCSSVEITKFNNTGRRITCVFRDEKNEIIIERRVYREWVERIVDDFSNN